MLDIINLKVFLSDIIITNPSKNKNKLSIVKKKHCPKRKVRDRQTDKQTNRQADKYTSRPIKKKHTNRQTHNQAKRQKQTNK